MNDIPIKPLLPTRWIKVPVSFLYSESRSGSSKAVSSHRTPKMRRFFWSAAAKRSGDAALD